MKKVWKILGSVAVVGLLGAVLLGGVVLADEAETLNRGPWARFEGYVDRMKDAFANRLGRSTDELDQAWSDARAQVVQQAMEEGLITQEQAERILEQETTFLGRNMMAPFGRMVKRARPFGRMGHPSIMPFGFNIMGQGLETVADVLGMEVEELTAQTREGQSIAEIAGDQLEAVKAALLERAAEAVNQAVQDGRLTQERADQILGNLSEQVDNLLNKARPECDCEECDGMGGDMFMQRGGRGGLGVRPFGRPEVTPEAEVTTTRL